MSSRWSYGPEGLREVPVKSRRTTELWPHWRDLQPLLLRSAGVVGLAGMIVAVIASNGWHSEDEARQVPEPVVLSPGDVAAAAAEPAPVPIVDVTPEKDAKLELRRAAEPEGDVANVDPMPKPEPAAPPPLAPEAQSAAAVPAPIDNQIASAGSDPETMSPTLAAADADAKALAEIAAAADFETAPLDGASDAPAEPASIVVAALEPTDTGSTTTGDAGAENDATLSVWADDAAACSRDWVAAHPATPEGDASDCAATTELIASVAEPDQSTLEEAADEHARELASLMPFVPRPRPEPPADFKPDVKPVRVARRNSDWPAEPPPNCGAGRHAKWHFVDRQAGTKEWYCK